MPVKTDPVSEVIFEETQENGHVKNNSHADTSATVVR